MHRTFTLGVYDWAVTTWAVTMNLLAVAWPLLGHAVICRKYKFVLTEMLLDPSNVMEGLKSIPTQHARWPLTGFSTLKTPFGETRNQLDEIS